MNRTVQRILDESQFTETIDGADFVLRVLSGRLAAEATGSKVLGLIRGGQVTSGKEIPVADIMEIMERYLTGCMISPKIGDQSSAELDTISLDDLGAWGPKILNAIFLKSGYGDLGNLGGSSGDIAEEN